MTLIHGGNAWIGYTAPLGKKSTVLSTPKIARGTSGSLTRTINRNIMLINASEVATTSRNIRSNLAILNGSGIPAMREQQVIRTTTAKTDFNALARLKTMINYNFRLFVTQ